MDETCQKVDYFSGKDRWALQNTHFVKRTIVAGFRRAPINLATTTQH
jgi:hypothetical protein